MISNKFYLSIGNGTLLAIFPENNWSADTYAMKRTRAFDFNIEFKSETKRTFRRE